jgi:hypothetical protein
VVGWRIVMRRLANYPDLASLLGTLLGVGPVNGAFLVTVEAPLTVQCASPVFIESGRAGAAVRDGFGAAGWLCRGSHYHQANTVAASSSEPRSVVPMMVSVPGTAQTVAMAVAASSGSPAE